MGLFGLSLDYLWLILAYFGPIWLCLGLFWPIPACIRLSKVYFGLSRVYFRYLDSFWSTRAFFGVLAYLRLFLEYSGGFRPEAWLIGISSGGLIDEPLF